MKQIQRTFIPGSEWVYFKLYTGTKIADKILTSNISSVIKKLEKEKLIDKWFFIRYADPDFHLRVRILVKDKLYIREVINTFYEQINNLVKTNLLWKVQLDTYNRELERYGNILIEDAESFFHIDSEYILAILKKLNATNNENYRWMIALKLIDQFLSDFALNTSSKKDLMEQLSNSFKMEFGFNKYNAKQFNSKYRESKNIVESVLMNTITEKEFVSLYSQVNKRSEKLKNIAKELNLKLEKKKQYSANINSILSSYIHMTLNRLFRANNRLHELILYDFLFRYYSSELAKEKYNIE